MRNSEDNSDCVNESIGHWKKQMIANCGRVRSANLHNIALSIDDIDYDDTEKEEDSNDDVDAADFFFGWFLNVLVNNLAISRTDPNTERLTILRAATHETERGGHDFCLSRSHYTDTDPTSRERAATAGIEPDTSSSGVARSTD